MGRGIYRETGDKICGFFQFFFEFIGLQIVKKRFVATANTHEPIRSHHVALVRHLVHTNASPVSRPLSPERVLECGREGSDITRSRRAPAVSPGDAPHPLSPRVERPRSHIVRNPAPIGISLRCKRACESFSLLDVDLTVNTIVIC
jgi:hypothetical protein